MAKRTSQTSVCRTTLLSVITACSLINMSLAVQSSWLFDSPFENSNCINAIPIIQTSTKLQCATLCGKLNECVGFLYKKDTLSCLHIDPNSSSDCMVYNSLQWTSWKKSTGQSIVTAVSTSTTASTTEQTTTPTTTTEQTTTPTTTTVQTTTPTTTTVQTTTPMITIGQPTCPTTLPIDTYTTTTLSDNTQFTKNKHLTSLWFVENGVDHPKALSRCPEYNGTLVQILSAPKMDFLMYYLVCLGPGDDVWIDAIKVDGMWKTSDGKDVLSDENYWHSLSTSGSQECAYLLENNFKMNEFYCRKARPYICEKTN